MRVNASHVPSTINEGKDLYVDVSNMGYNDVLFSEYLKFILHLKLTVTNNQRTIVSNIGKIIVRNLCITLTGNEV